MKVPAPKKRRADRRFGDLVRSYPPAPGKLPWVHITRAYSFAEILGTQVLRPTYCDVFGEDLIYLFYGRPSYRAKDGNNARLEFEWPIILIFDPDKIKSIKRVFPFDTGAFAKKLYSEFFDPQSKLPDFEIEPSLDGARKLVSMFYVDHAEYYYGASRKNVQLDFMQFEAQGVLELSRLPGVQGSHVLGTKRDERSSAIEAQVNRSIPLRDTLLAIILPEPYIGNTEVQHALKRWRPKVIESYMTLHNMSGEVWVGQIYEIVRKVYSQLGLL